MVKKYYEPYEQMYRKIDLKTGEVIDPTEETAQEESPDTVILTPEKITPSPGMAAGMMETEENPKAPEDENDLDVPEGQTDIARETISEQDAASYIVQTPLSKFNLRGIFDNFELDDLIIIGLLIILLMEDGGEDGELDFPLIIILGFLLLSDFL